jgi:hypothetical protein
VTFDLEPIKAHAKQRLNTPSGEVKLAATKLQYRDALEAT